MLQVQATEENWKKSTEKDYCWEQIFKKIFGKPTFYGTGVGEGGAWSEVGEKGTADGGEKEMYSELSRPLGNSDT